MPGPSIAITAGRIEEGKLAEYREPNAAISALVETFTAFGASTEAFDDYLKAMADAGIAIQHLRNHVRGFTRSSATD